MLSLSNVLLLYHINVLQFLQLIFVFLSLSQMEIVCEHQQFRILVDGQPLCGFAHRFTQLASLTALRVSGDLQLTKVAWVAWLDVSAMMTDYL